MTSIISEHGHHHHHHHHHGQRRFFHTKTFRLLAMLSLTFTYFVVELIVGNLTRSVALVADAFHMLSDVISLVIGIVAVRIIKRRSDINTYGWVRAEVVGANINTVFLLALCLTIVFDAIRRFIEPEPIEKVDLLLIVGAIGLGINIIGLFLFQGFHGHSHGPKKTEPNTEDQTNEQNKSRFERHSSRALQEVRD
jgi:zinc transporter 1